MSVKTIFTIQPCCIYYSCMWPGSAERFYSSTIIIWNRSACGWVERCLRRLQRITCLTYHIQLLFGKAFLTFNKNGLACTFTQLQPDSLNRVQCELQCKNPYGPIQLNEQCVSGFNNGTFLSGNRFVGFVACLRTVVDLQLKTNVKMIVAGTQCLNKWLLDLEQFMVLWSPRSVF